MKFDELLQRLVLAVPIGDNPEVKVHWCDEGDDLEIVEVKLEGDVVLLVADTAQAFTGETGL